MKTKLLALAAAGILLTGCNARKDVVYLQDLKVDNVATITAHDRIMAEPGDQLQIIISCKEPELASVLNMPLVSLQSTSSMVNTTNTIIAYTVDNDGTIDFPIVGSLKVGGLTRDGIRELVASKIKEMQLIQDFVVTVNFSNLKIYVMGEVSNPGTYAITDNNTNVLQALAMARDLTISGKRDEVYVIREEGEKRLSYKLDLRKEDIFNSPAFYLKQNDVVYVAPNKMRANQSTVSGNSLQNSSFWISLASIVTTMYLAFIK